VQLRVRLPQSAASDARPRTTFHRRRAARPLRHARHQLRRSVMRSSLLFLWVIASACVGTTGGDVIDFPAAASGPRDAEALKTNGFDTDLGWHVVLAKATLHVGALYLSQTQPVSGAQ